MELKGEQISLVPLAAVALEGEFVEISSPVRRRNAFRHRDVRLQSRSFARWNSFALRQRQHRHQSRLNRRVNVETITANAMEQLYLA